MLQKQRKIKCCVNDDVIKITIIFTKYMSADSYSCFNVRKNEMKVRKDKKKLP